ncbi:MAG: UDP-N-acetylmuramoyl-tripeptide--D-alanyl-D-alanine ligase, partial [Moraxellaceae bacterium]
AKGEIYQNLTSTDTAVINIDDKFSPQFSSTTTAKKITVSLHDSVADCHANAIQFSQNSVSFELNIHQGKIGVILNALGDHNVRNALMAAAMSFAVGASLQQIQQGLSEFSAVGGRMSRHSGFNNSLIIDDSYNANPGSVRAAIDVLATQDGQKILVLGDLGELGSHENELHAGLGDYAKHKNITHLYTLGVLTQHASNAFGDQVGQHHFTDRDLLVMALKNLATPDTTILIKGSRSAKMDLVVSALCSAGDNY